MLGARLAAGQVVGSPDGQTALYGPLRDSAWPALCAVPPDASHARAGGALVVVGSGAVLATGDATGRARHPRQPPLAVWGTSAFGLLCYRLKTSAPHFPPPKYLGAQGTTMSASGGRADVPATWPESPLVAMSGSSRCR